MNKSTIKLFRAVSIKTKRKKKLTKKILLKTIEKGFIFSEEVFYNYSEKELLELIRIIEKEIGLTAEQMNSSFHKSWQKIKEASIEQLVVEQLAHYLTTYGKDNPGEYVEEKEEQWGIDNLGEKIIGLKDFESNKVGDNYIYIPKEKLEIPKLKEDIKLTVIKGYTKEELKEKLLNLLNLGIALKGDTIDLIVEIALFMKLNEKEIEGIKNKEAKIILYDYLGLVPENSVEFLRYIVYKATEKTLLIKNAGLIEEIKDKKNIAIIRLFNDYDKKYGLKKLAEIFYRFKPIFLAFRTNKELKKIINKIRRLAKVYHKPLKEDYLNLVTSEIKNSEIDKRKLKTALDGANIFRKIRLAYALKFRTKDTEAILYKIRNGKGFATGFSFLNKSIAKDVLDIVLKSISKDLRKNIKGKKIYIPEFIEYSLPATEKQFTDNFPNGTYISIPKEMIVGIYWDNVKNSRIDLDLSLISLSTGKIGWDASYRTEDKKVLFSGDMTNAANGASELFSIQKQERIASIMVVNYYNYDSDIEVPFKIIVAKEHPDNFKENYMVDPNNIISIAKSEINQKQKILGLLVTTPNRCRFYFSEVYLGKSITSSESEFIKNSRKYLFDFYSNTITLNDILEKAGAKIIDTKEGCDIDLSPENLEKDTILNLIK